MLKLHLTMDMAMVMDTMDMDMGKAIMVTIMEGEQQRLNLVMPTMSLLFV